MKNKLSLIIGALALATTAGVKAQTAVTDPVGYITLTAKGNGGSGKKLSFVSPTLVNKVEFSGAITAITPTQITVAGTPLATFAANAYYVEITSGTNAGYWTNITGGTSSSVTTADDMDAVANPGDTIKIRKHVTISDLFGATNTAGLLSGGSSTTADILTVLDPQTKVATRIFYYVDPTNPAVAGWITEDGELAADFAIEPAQAVQITRIASADLSIVRVGHVKTGPTKLGIEPGLNLVAVPLATGTTLSTSGLRGTGNANGVSAGGSLTTADVLRFVTPAGAVLQTFFYQDPNDANVTGWLDENGEIQNDYVIKEGTGFLLSRKTAAGAFPWSAPAQVIAQ